MVDTSSPIHEKKYINNVCPLLISHHPTPIYPFIVFVYCFVFFLPSAILLFSFFSSSFCPSGIILHFFLSTFPSFPFLCFLVVNFPVLDYYDIFFIFFLSLLLLIFFSSCLFFLFLHFLSFPFNILLHLISFPVIRFVFFPSFPLSILPSPSFLPI